MTQIEKMDSVRNRFDRLMGCRLKTVVISMCAIAVAARVGLGGYQWWQDNHWHYEHKAAMEQIQVIQNEISRFASAAIRSPGLSLAEFDETLVEAYPSLQRISLEEARNLEQSSMNTRQGSIPSVNAAVTNRELKPSAKAAAYRYRAAGVDYLFEVSLRGDSSSGGWSTDIPPTLPAFVIARGFLAIIAAGVGLLWLSALVNCIRYPQHKKLIRPMWRLAAVGGLFVLLAMRFSAGPLLFVALDITMSAILIGLLVAIPTLAAECWVLYNVRKRSPRWCRQCNYNLTGNTSGVCPECGSAIPPDQRAVLDYRNPQFESRI